MKFHISSPEQIGPLVRASRKAMQLRQDAAGSIGVSDNFLGKVERGSDSVQWGKLFQVIQELGLFLSVEVPEPFAEQIQARLEAAQSKGAGFSSPADGGCRR
ncbi:transcriptional regulator [Pseudomonas sp.]|uniref:transcriptional regulator n=1 Tax=Pseudomonas sp. TaxID=306 RepID=UPI003CC58D32